MPIIDSYVKELEPGLIPALKFFNLKTGKFNVKGIVNQKEMLATMKPMVHDPSRVKQNLMNQMWQSENSFNYESFLDDYDHLRLQLKEAVETPWEYSYSNYKKLFDLYEKKQSGWVATKNFQKVVFPTREEILQSQYKNLINSIRENPQAFKAKPDVFWKTVGDYLPQPKSENKLKLLGTLKHLGLNDSELPPILTDGFTPGSIQDAADEITRTEVSRDPKVPRFQENMSKTQRGGKCDYRAILRKAFGWTGLIKKSH